MKIIVTEFFHLISMHLLTWANSVLTAFGFKERIFHNVEIQSMFAGFTDDSCLTICYRVSN